MKFKKGNKVKVVNSGQVYSGFDEMAKKLKLKNWEDGKFVRSGIVGKIVNISGYHVGITTQEGDFVIGEEGLELVSPEYKPKTPTHLVVWEEDEDPYKFFTSEQEANEFIKELSEKDNVNKDSIVLVEIKSCKKITISKRLTTKEFKI